MRKVTTAQQVEPISGNNYGKFEWSDPLLIETELTEEERIVCDTARTFCQDELMPEIIIANRDERFDTAILKRYGELGFLGCTLPETYGGSDSSYVTYGLIAREMERVDSSYRSAMSVQSSLVMHPVISTMRY